MNEIQLHPLVLSLYPFSRGFAYVFLEAPDSPFEWGVKYIEGNLREQRALDEVRKLIVRYRPEVIVVEDKGVKRRTVRIRKMYRAILFLAKSENVEVYQCTRREVDACFESSGAKTKRDIAKEIALRIRAFAHRLPPVRKPWQGEDPRQSLFDAATFALAYYWKYNEPSQK